MYYYYQFTYEKIVNEIDLYIWLPLFAVAPINFWTAQKIFNNKIHGSNPIAAHGKIRSINGGLQLNGQDSWLDAGDFFGQCLGDPDLCIKGFSYALQVRSSPLSYPYLCNNTVQYNTIQCNAMQCNAMQCNTIQ